MTTIISLNKEDITKIIAEKFKVSEKQVYVDLSSVCEGYGPTERMVPSVSVKITIQRSDVKDAGVCSQSL